MKKKNNFILYHLLHTWVKRNKKNEKNNLILYQLLHTWLLWPLHYIGRAHCNIISLNDWITFHPPTSITQPGSCLKNNSHIMSNRKWSYNLLLLCKLGSFAAITFYSVCACVSLLYWAAWWNRCIKRTGPLLLLMVWWQAHIVWRQPNEKLHSK